jgi:hypothetical protein
MIGPVWLKKYLDELALDWKLVLVKPHPVLLCDERILVLFLFHNI